MTTCRLGVSHEGSPGLAYLILVLSVASGPAWGQDTKAYAEAYRQQLENRRVEVDRAYRRFIDKSVPFKERADAVAGIGSFLTTEQAEGAKQVFRDASETPELRAIAVERVPNPASDPTFLAMILEQIASPSAAMTLRAACLRVMGALSIATSKGMPWRPQYLTVLRGLTDDPEPSLRESAFAALTAARDDYATQKLTAGLRSPELAKCRQTGRSGFCP